MFPKLYDERSRVRRALSSIGRLLSTKIDVASVPATTGRESMRSTLVARVAGPLRSNGPSRAVPDG
jgi:hypothetical protein